jgi:hypothetical protein
VGKSLLDDINHFVNSMEGKTNAGIIGDALPSAVYYAFR